MMMVPYMYMRVRYMYMSYYWSMDDYASGEEKGSESEENKSRA